MALAAKVCKGLIGATVRKAYREQGRPIWEEWRADDDIEKTVRGAFVSILSRAFSPANEAEGEEAAEGEEERLLEPLLDMLQHSAEPSVSHR